MSGAAEAVAAVLCRDLRPSGIDLVFPFARSWVAHPEIPAHGLPALGRADPLCVLLGNSRALWPAFLAALRAGHADPDAAHPLDEWVGRCVRDAVARLGVAHEIRFAWEPPPRRVPMQHLAHRAGFAHLSPSHLCVHPAFGPWIGIRAAVVLDLPGPVGPGPPAWDPCTPCARPCLEARARALAAPSWQAWGAVREVCPVGRAHAYSQEQLAYHSTADRRWLRAAEGTGALTPEGC